MRRLAALLLMLWACVFAPVLPLVAAQPEEPAVCACCKGGPCQHNACPIPATPGSLLCPVEASVRLAPVSARRSEAAVRRQLKGTCFVQHDADADAAQLSRASTWPARARIDAAAVVPLFTAHCSFLI
jgi:hypothetical protein